MRNNWMYVLTLAGCLAGSVLGQAATAQLINGDLESGAYVFDGNGANSLPAGSTVITGWTTISNELAVINTPNNFGITAQSGIISLDLTGYHDGPPYGGIQQLVNTVAGQNYTLDFFIGQAGSTASGISVGTVGAPTTYTATIGGSFWQEFTTSFTATGPTLLSFTGVTPAHGGDYIGLDHITLTGNFTPTATPEPGSLALFAGLGLSGGVLLRRRRPRNKA